MKKGFTMIELIFVIVILGILAAVAIPKLAATRDDAQNAKDCSNVATCVADLGAEYTASALMTPASSQACVSAQASSQNAITVTPGDSDADGVNDQVTIALAPAMCAALNTVSVFGGSSISF